MDAPAFPARWKVSAPELIAETFSSRIWKVRREDGSPAIVKALKPFDDVADELRGEHFLAWRRGEGAVRLLGRDGHSMLLEFAGETLLSKVLDEQGDKIATEIAAEMMARLLSPSKHSFPSELQPLRERFASLFKKAATDRANGHGSLYVEAAAIADRLLADPRNVRPLHGDLHHQNILHGPRGWLAIDPKGVLGDPGFDAANMFYNPLDRDALCLDPERIAHMAEVFAMTLKQTPAAMLDHAIAYGCLSAAWHHEDDNAVEENRELSIAAAIRTVRAAF
ncbi:MULTISPECIES: aminoglycoside phosphotransferase family protein [unclassified Mesorhizobium]|uniref:aminoglycoside phosphotransferase family protein n=1 Tax=unclassified Mesorhizobium TaxID=325217 RepID=UPI00112E3729|nr:MULTISPECIES: aminoglycoside phosphotransferase family protein [unclassified Mesorhizobium]TPN48581.1 3'-kinase [Mesorhizobium sp. B1-1-7]TPN49460.1 3'-kinase [Mesorhizobium sp. B1-1-9]